MDATQEDGHDEAGPSTRSRPELEAEILALAARVEEFERERRPLEEFAGLAAHEVLKPLLIAEAGANGALARAGDRLDADSRDELEAVATAAAQARRLVETLLADAQQAGRPLERTEVDLAPVVRSCLDALAVEIRRRGARVEVGPLPVVAGNAALLGGVFTNLVANALEHGSRRGGVIRISSRPVADGWMLAVDSPGRRIPEQDRSRIFELPRLGVRRDPHGAGLGLVLVRRLVERHGGEVGVTAPEGRGNRFFFTLRA